MSRRTLEQILLEPAPDAQSKARRQVAQIKAWRRIAKRVLERLNVRPNLLKYTGQSWSDTTSDPLGDFVADFFLPRFEAYDQIVNTYLSKRTGNDVTNWLKVSFKRFAIDLLRKYYPYYSAIYAVVTRVIGGEHIDLNGSAHWISREALMRAMRDRYERVSRTLVADGYPIESADYLPRRPIIKTPHSKRGKLGAPEFDVLTQWFHGLRPCLTGRLRATDLANCLQKAYGLCDAHLSDRDATAETSDDQDEGEKMVIEGVNAVQWIIESEDDDGQIPREPSWVYRYWSMLNEQKKTVIRTMGLTRAESALQVFKKDTKRNQSKVTELRREIAQELRLAWHGALV